MYREQATSLGAYLSLDSVTLRRTLRRGHTTNQPFFKKKTEAHRSKLAMQPRLCVQILCARDISKVNIQDRLSLHSGCAPNEGGSKWACNMWAWTKPYG